MPYASPNLSFLGRKAHFFWDTWAEQVLLPMLLKKEQKQQKTNFVFISWLVSEDAMMTVTFCNTGVVLLPTLLSTQWA